MTSLSAVSIRHLELVTDPAGHTADRRKMHLAFPIGLARADCFDSEKPTVCLIYMVVSLIKLYNIQDVMKEKTVPAFMELTILLGYQTSISEICVNICGTCSGYNRNSERKEIHSNQGS